MSTKIFKNTRKIINFGDVNPLVYGSGILYRTSYNDIVCILSLEELNNDNTNEVILYDTFINFVSYDLESKKYTCSLEKFLSEYNFIEVNEISNFIGCEVNQDNFNTIYDLMDLFTSCVQYYGYQNFQLDRSIYKTYEAKKIMRIY